MTKKDKKTYLIPMEVTRETIEGYGIKKQDVVPAKIGNKIVSAIMIPTDDEELYLSYMRPIWAEMKREERSRRCIVASQTASCSTPSAAAGPPSSPASSPTGFASQ